jgi:hypothetical protein
MLGWSVIAVKPNGRGGSAGLHCDWTSNKKCQNGRQNIIFDVISEVQKDLEVVSAGIGICFNPINQNFFHNLTSKLVRPTLTSPSRIRVNEN